MSEQSEVGTERSWNRAKLEQSKVIIEQSWNSGGLD